jgi:diguanylate cyclase (GGDEF)-like protein
MTISGANFPAARVVGQRWRSGRRGRVGRALLAAAALVAVVAPAAVGLARTQASSRHELEARFRARGALGAGFASAYIADLVTRERHQAVAQLGAAPEEAEYQELVATFGFQAAVLLDGQGRVLEITPPKPSLIGTPIAGKYAHLTAAVDGRVGISKVVPSAATGVPVLAFAVPYETPAGRRVFSGAFEVAQTPLDSYLGQTVSINPHNVYLIDDTGAIAASSPTSDRGSRHLPEENPALFEAMRTRASGAYQSSTGPAYFTSQELPGTPLQLVASVPAAQLYKAIGGTGGTLPWIILGLLAVIGALALWVLLRYAAGRRELARLYEELELIARLDPVTGIYNRRHLQERMELDLRLARRRDEPVALLMVDIDHFKLVNDTFGHEAGDAVLQLMAQHLKTTMREEDTIGRWGGEEFLAVLPFTTLDAAAAVAERLRASVAAQPFVTPSGTAVVITVSVGYAAGVGVDAHELSRRADAALYCAKEAGRNRIAGSPVPDHGPRLPDGTNVR